MPACTTPLLWLLWCAATAGSRSKTATRRPRPGCRSSRAVARPISPAPTTARSHSAGGWIEPEAATGCHDGEPMAFPTFGLYIGGRWRDGDGGLENRNPAHPDVVVSAHALARP